MSTGYKFIIYQTRNISNADKAEMVLTKAGIKCSLHFTYTDRCQIRIPWTNMDDVEKAKNVLREARIMKKKKLKITVE